MNFSNELEGITSARFKDAWPLHHHSNAERRAREQTIHAWGTPTSANLP